MGKAVYIAEKPSVAQEFAKALKLNAKRKDGYLESEEAIVTWCVGHLVTMSYPEVYDPALKKWSLNTLPFLPQEFQYEVIPGVAKQFQIVSSLLNRQDVFSDAECIKHGRHLRNIGKLSLCLHTSGRKSLNSDPPLIPKQTCDTFDDRRFSGSVWSQKDPDCTIRYKKTDLIHRQRLSIGFT